MKRSQTEPKGPWQKTPYANLIRYVPSRTYFARIRIQGKLIVKSLKTDSIAVAKLRLADLEKDERQNAEHRATVTTGKMTFGDCLALYRERLQADPKFKPRTKEHYEYRTKAVGMTRITHHDLRHLFATRCIEFGVDTPTVSHWLGHRDGGALATRTHGHLRDQHSTEMAQRVTFMKTIADESPAREQTLSMKP